VVERLKAPPRRCHIRTYSRHRQVSLLSASVDIVRKVASEEDHPHASTVADEIRAASRLPSRRQQQRDETRRKLASSAQHMFLTEGYTRTTVDMIAAGAGTSRPAFYLHFADKSAILLELFDEIMPGVLAHWERLDRILVAGDREDFRAWLYSTAEWYAAHGRLATILQEGDVFEPAIQARQEVSALAIMATLKRYLKGQRAQQRRETAVRLQLLRAHLLDSLHPRAVAKLDARGLNTVVTVLVDLWWPTLISTSLVER
jgi:AcrR family transcriptional regulator